MPCKVTGCEGLQTVPLPSPCVTAVYWLQSRCKCRLNLWVPSSDVVYESCSASVDVFEGYSSLICIPLILRGFSVSSILWMSALFLRFGLIFE
jgi:hypothetical protein